VVRRSALSASRHAYPLVIARIRPPCPSCRRGWRPQPGDQGQDFGEHLSRHRDLGQLDGHVAAVAHHLCADLDQLLAQAGQRPRRRRLGQCQRPHEIPKVIREHMELEADGIGGEGAAGQPGPFDRTLALLDPLFRRAALVVEGDHPFGRPRQVCGSDQI